MQINRRRFLKSCSGMVAAPYLLGASFKSTGSQIKNSMSNYVDQYADIPKIFCIAYIDPKIQSQRDKERIISKYPLALIPQSMHKSSVQWRDKIKYYNPDIALLAYQMVIEQTTVPGPGHDELRKLNNSYVEYFDSFRPQVGSAKKKRYIYDPRKVEWQDNFLSACTKTLKSYPYEGLFLDQCTIFTKSHPNPYVRADMRKCLQEVILELRNKYPDKIIIANSSEEWSGVNGELCEGRVNDWETELASSSMHVKPEMNLAHIFIKDSNDHKKVEKHMKLAHELGGVFGVSVNYQDVHWYDCFEDLESAVKL